MENTSNAPDMPEGKKLNITVTPGMSQDTKLIITVIALVFFYPLGVILMWVWMKWPLWVRLLVSSLLLLPVLAIIMAIMLITASPNKQFSQANNTKRSSDVNAIVNAVQMYKAANNNVLPPGIGNAPMPISSQGINICEKLQPTYIAGLPVDPLTNNGMPVTDCSVQYDTGYVISVDASGRVIVQAPHAELGAQISVTR